MVRQSDAALGANVVGQTGDVAMAALVRPVLAVLNVVAELEMRKNKLLSLNLMYRKHLNTKI